MKLNDILSISGHPGLYKLVASGKNNIIVESLVDGSRIPAFSTDKVSALSDIALYTTAEELSLTDVFKKMYTAFDKKEVNLNFKKQTKEMLASFEKAVPEYDKTRVYTSDIKKLMTWYNILIKKDMINLEEEKVEETKPVEEVKSGPKAEVEEKPVAKTEKKTTKKSPAAAKEGEEKPKKTTAQKKPAAEKK